MGTATTSAQNAATRTASHSGSRTIPYSTSTPKYGLWIGFQAFQKVNGTLGGMGTGAGALPQIDYAALANTILSKAFVPQNVINNLIAELGLGKVGAPPGSSPNGTTFNEFTQGGVNMQRPPGASAGVGLDTVATNLGSVYLPEPIIGMTDAMDVQYTESAIGAHLASAIGGIFEGGGAIAALIKGVGLPLVQSAIGIAPNQFLTVLLSGPTYKRYTMLFALAPNSEIDSQRIRDLINRLRLAASPQPHGYIFWEFPQVCQCIYVPQGDALDTYLYRFKPAVLEKVEVNYAPYGASFYKSTAPEMIMLRLDFHELQYWIRSDFERPTLTGNLGTGLGNALGANNILQGPGA